MGPQQHLIAENGVDGGMAYKEWEIRNNGIKLMLHFQWHKAHMLHFSVAQKEFSHC
jgi:hypothetical protein